MKTYYGIVGAGGYGREVMPLARSSLSGSLASGEVDLLFVVEGEITSHMVNGCRVISLEDFKALDAPRYFNIAISNSKARSRIAQDCLKNGIKAFPIYATNTVILDENTIGEGAIFSPFTTVTSNAQIGKFFHANIYSYVAHDCVIGDYVTFAPGVKCNGNVFIEDYAYIGTGAEIKEGKTDRPLVIGRGAVIGMGAVVTRDVPANTTIVGNPAKPIGKK